MKLLPKITLLMLFVLVGLLSIFSYIIIKDEQKTFNNFLQKEGELLTKTISASSIETILVDDYPLLESILKNISDTYDSISYIRILKDEKIISQINKHNVNKSDILIFESDIKIDSDVLASVKIGLSTKEYDEIINQKMKQFLLSIGIISILLFVLLMFVVEKYLLIHIDKLKSHTKLIGTKDYSDELTINTSDEFEDLANSINKMSNRIHESYDDLIQQSIIQEKQKKELVEANKYKNDFLANMSHELKTPLNSINVISSVMMKNRQNTLDDKQVKNLEIINSCGNDLLYLINDVLDLSKLEAGEVELDYTQFDLHKLMYDIKDMFEPQAHDKNLEIIFECDNSINEVYSDKNRIKQIIKNLLSNSLKFVNSGTIYLIVKDLNENFSVLVKDDGIGIEKHKLEHIFDRFKQADGSTTRKYGGTGLGLAICKELLDLLEGEISVKSEVNIGTSFTITVPINKDKITKFKEDIILPSKTTKVNKNKKILVLNNDPISFMGIIIGLKKEFEVTQTSKLLDFIKYNKENMYNILIIDVSKEKNEKIINLLNVINTKTIIVYKDDIPQEIKQKAYLSLKKPIEKNNFIFDIIDIINVKDK